MKGQLGFTCLYEARSMPKWLNRCFNTSLTRRHCLQFVKSGFAWENITHSWKKFITWVGRRRPSAWEAYSTRCFSARSFTSPSLHVLLWFRSRRYNIFQFLKVLLLHSCTMRGLHYDYCSFNWVVILERRRVPNFVVKLWDGDVGRGVHQPAIPSICDSSPVWHASLSLSLTETCHCFSNKSLRRGLIVKIDKHFSTNNK
jgi:hypothetical protein